MKKFYLYKIQNKINSKVYIGITAYPKNRLTQHFSKNSSCTKLKNAIAKYGKENFEFTVLCIGQEDYILDLEKKAIDSYDSINTGYNLVYGNPKTGGASLSEDTKQSISAGLNKYYSENPGWNLGGTVEKRSDDYQVYAMGFWFPNARTAISSLGINPKTFYKRKAEGTLGNVFNPTSDCIVFVPQYIAGFWFNNLATASEKLNVSLAALRKRVREGNLEQENSRSKSKLENKNPMFGRKGGQHPNSRAIKIFGKTYDSISDAVRETEYTKSMIEKRLKKNIEGFEYVNP